MVMLSNLPTAASMSQVDAWKRYSTFLKRVKVAPNKDARFQRFLSLACTVLETHPIAESDSNKRCLPESGNDVADTVRDLLEAYVIFLDIYFTSAIYSVRLLFDVTGFYAIQSLSVDWDTALALSDAERAAKAILATAWQYYMLVMSPEDTRDVLGR